MNCKTRLLLLQPPVTTIFSGVFILLSLVATVANVIIFAIIWKKTSIKKSYKFLISLVISDTLTGSIQGPLTAWQLLYEKTRLNCSVDLVRRHLLVFFVGSSYLILAVIAYDRFISLNKLNNNNRRISERKSRLLILFSWLCPASLPFIRFAGTIPYRLITSTIFIASVTCLVYCYYSIAKSIRKQKQVMERYGSTVVQRNQSGRNRSDSWHHRSEKTVLVLIICHLSCSLPIFFLSCIELSNSKFHLIDPAALQNCYIFLITLSQSNSCLNPFIYFLTNCKFRKELRALF